jgi:hypothetical protein
VSPASTTSAILDLRTTFGGLVQSKITNGGTGPTIGCTARIDASIDGSNWFTLAEQTAGVTANQPYPFNIVIPEHVMYIRSVYTGNTAQDVTVEAIFHESSSVG